jgi:hypothetical protein
MPVSNACIINLVAVLSTFLKQLFSWRHLLLVIPLGWPHGFVMVKGALLFCQLVELMQSQT